VLEAVTYTADEGLYCSFNDLYLEYGEVNVLLWANMDGLPVGHVDYWPLVNARMTEFITQASQEVNESLAPSMEVPFTGDRVTATINRVTRMKAGGWLYEARGMDDIDIVKGQAVHRYTPKLTRADKMLEQIASDKRRMFSTDSEGAIRVPGVVQ